jgi:hypothetical protein
MGENLHGCAASGIRRGSYAGRKGIFSNVVTESRPVKRLSEILVLVFIVLLQDLTISLYKTTRPSRFQLP